MPTMTVSVFQRSRLPPFLTFSLRNTWRCIHNKTHQAETSYFLRTSIKTTVLEPKHALWDDLRDLIVRNVLFSEIFHN